MTRFRFVVTPSDDGWVVHSSGRVLERYPTGGEAVDAIIRRARVNQPSVLIVEGRDGSMAHGRSSGHDPDEAAPTPAPGSSRVPGYHEGQEAR